MREHTRPDDEAQFPIAADRFTTWAESNGADVTREDDTLVARWSEDDYIEMGTGSINAWREFNSPPWRQPALSIDAIEPEPEPLSMTGAGRGELRSASVRGDTLTIESTHRGEDHTYEVVVNR